MPGGGSWAFFLIFFKKKFFFKFWGALGGLGGLFLFFSKKNFFLSFGGPWGHNSTKHPFAISKADNHLIGQHRAYTDRISDLYTIFI